MDPNLPPRFHDDIAYPKSVYFEMVATFLFGNFVYHKNVFRRNGNKLNFGIFLFVNAFTSYNLCEMLNANVLRYNAAIYNNTVEFEHKVKLNAQLRKTLFGAQN